MNEAKYITNPSGLMEIAQRAMAPICHKKYPFIKQGLEWIRVLTSLTKQVEGKGGAAVRARMIGARSFDLALTFPGSVAHTCAQEKKKKSSKNKVHRRLAVDPNRNGDQRMHRARTPKTCDARSHLQTLEQSQPIAMHRQRRRDLPSLGCRMFMRAEAYCVNVT